MAFMTVQDKSVTKHALGNNEFSMKVGFLRTVRDTCPKGSADWKTMDSIMEVSFERQQVTPNMMDAGTKIYIKHKVN